MLRLLEDSCALQIGVLGLNFKTAGLDLQEEMARGASSLSGERGFFFRCPTIILSTCNRTEIYFGGEDLAAIHSDLLAWLRSLIQEPFEHRLYSYFGIDCFSHLCRVVSGLDSAVLAETEIQRQVKVAYQQTAQCLSLPSSLHYVFQKALKVGKAVRSQFLLKKGSPSLFSAIWQLTQKFFKDELPSNVLFVGYSELTRLIVPSFLRKGIDRITLCTKYPSTVRLASCAVVGREALDSWVSFDLIICASKANRYLIQGPGAPGKLVFDLSVPRNVDPSVGQTSQLYNMEQINACIERSRRQHMIYVGQSEELVKTSVRHLARIYKQKQMAQSTIFSCSNPS